MITHTRTVYTCEHCRRTVLTKRTMVAHEHVCFKNPERVPLPGELLRSEHWTRYVFEERFPAWWPTNKTNDLPELGCMWDGTEWVGVPGWEMLYDVDYASVDGEPYLIEPSHTVYIDKWPIVDGVPLDELSRGQRLEWLNAKLAGIA